MIGTRSNENQQTTAHISDETADYLKQRLHQLAYEQLDHEQNVNHEETQKKDIQKPSNVSLLTMFLASPSKTCPLEMTSLDLSDHESMSGHSTPTPPLMLQFTPKSSVKFVAAQPKANVHEIVHTLSPILQQPSFSDVPHVDQTTKSQHHVRFMAMMDHKEQNTTMQVSKLPVPLSVTDISTDSTKTKSNLQASYSDSGTHSVDHIDLLPKSSNKILLDNVLPKERINLVEEEEEELEDEEQVEGEEDEGEEGIQDSVNHVYENYYHYQNFESKISDSNSSIKNNFNFKSTLYQDDSFSYHLQNYLKPSIDNIDHIKSVSISKQIDSQDDMDLILGNLDEDQSASYETTFPTQMSTKKPEVITPHDIDPTFPYSDTEESDSVENSSVKEQALYHHSPPIRTKSKKNSLSIKSLPGQKKSFYEKQCITECFKKKAIHTINIPLHKDKHHQKYLMNDKNLEYPYENYKIGKREKHIHKQTKESSFHISC